MPAYSGLYDGHFGAPHTLLANTVAIGSDYRKLATLFSKRPYGRAVTRELIKMLTGAAVGQSAASTHKRVQATVNREGVDGGGLVSVETFTEISRVTATADLTRVDAALALSTKPTYAADRSGVGGGAKLGV